MNVLEVDYLKVLEDAYKTHKSLIVCFDFDNTVYDYHNRDIDFSPVIDLLLECQELGFKLLCSTANIDMESILFKYEYLYSLGLTTTTVNLGDGVVDPEQIPFSTQKYVKPYANIYLDDKAGLREAYQYLRTLVNNIKQNKYE